MKRNHPILPAYPSCETSCFTCRHAFLLIIFLFTFFHSNSQRQPIRFEHIGADLGLFQSSILSIFQDSRGFLWFGTRDGLNKYDGYKFTVYKNDVSDTNSISYNTVQDITEDREGNLWIGTWGRGVNKFDWRKGKFIQQHFITGQGSSNKKNYINKLFWDSENNLWVGTEMNGLYIVNFTSGTTVHFIHDETDPSSLSCNRIKDIVEDGHHNIWLGTLGGGVEMFDRKTKSFLHFRHDASDSTSVASDDSWELFVDSKDRLWV